MTVIMQQPQGSSAKCDFCFQEKQDDIASISQFCSKACCIPGIFSGCYLTSGAGIGYRVLGAGLGGIGCAISGASCCTPVVEMSLQRVCMHGPEDPVGISWTRGNEESFRDGFQNAMKGPASIKSENTEKPQKMPVTGSSDGELKPLGKEKNEPSIAEVNSFTGKDEDHAKQE